MSSTPARGHPRWGVVRASLGSEYTNSDTGEDWEKVSGDTSAEGWVLA